MSYNITAFHLKKIERLKIPLQSFFKYAPEEWEPQLLENADGSATIWIMKTEIDGCIENNFFQVQNLECSGEGSGHIMQTIIEPALQDGTGQLVAVCIWEGGDYISRLSVTDGIVKWEKVEI